MPVHGNKIQDKFNRLYFHHLGAGPNVWAITEGRISNCFDLTVWAERPDEGLLRDIRGKTIDGLVDDVGAYGFEGDLDITKHEATTCYEAVGNSHAADSRQKLDTTVVLEVLQAGGLLYLQ
ncbi:hypothetical protein HPB47_006622 [Ixodes persulcatus]|uniref:Uncharacterized protein n=1 Tax=Ixodes persulcatus TaxID=34615 RepID=A0AC60PAN7_IXOPE|nr:hypothetical protein HPB47_006622 [Ixodes persulcatus]